MKTTYYHEHRVWDSCLFISTNSCIFLAQQYTVYETFCTFYKSICVCPCLLFSCWCVHMCVMLYVWSFPCVAVHMLVYGWQALTEGHGSCTLSVWTLAEPLGVLFQARSDNLAPMTRLATAQFTGRSSTHAQPPHSHLSSSPLLSPSLFPLHPSSPPYPHSPLNLSLSLPLCCSFSSITPPAFPSLSLSVSITLLSTGQELSFCWHLWKTAHIQTCKCRTHFLTYQTPSHSRSESWNKLQRAHLWLTFFYFFFLNIYCSFYTDQTVFRGKSWWF